MKRINKEGAANIKFYLILLVVGGFFLFLTLNQPYKKEGSPRQAAKSALSLKDKAANHKKTGSNNNGNIKPAQAPTQTIKNFDTERSLSRVRGYIKEIEGENISLKEKASQLSAVLEAREKELVGLDKENSFLKDELDKAAKNQSELRAQMESGINTYKEQLSKKELDISNLGSVKANLESQVVQLNSKFLELAGVNSYLEKQITQNQQERSSLGAQLNAIKEELNRQVLVNETLDKKVAELNSSLNIKEQERSDAAKSLETAEENKKALELEISQLKNIKEANEKKIIELNLKISELNASQENMWNKVSSLNNDKSALEQQLQKLGSSIQDKDKAIEGLQQSGQQLSVKLKDYENKISEFSVILSKKELEIDSKQKELYPLRESLDKANKEKDALTLVLNKKEKSLSELDVRLEQMKSQTHSLKAELAVAKKLQSKTAGQLEKLTAGGSSPEKLKKANAANKVLHAKILSIYQELEMLRTEAKMRDNNDLLQKENKPEGTTE